MALTVFATKTAIRNAKNPPRYLEVQKGHGNRNVDGVHVKWSHEKQSRGLSERQKLINQTSGRNREKLEEPDTETLGKHRDSVRRNHANSDGSRFRRA